MSKRIYVSVSDDFYDWIVVEAEKNGLAVATFATTLLNQARRNLQSLSDFSNLAKVLVHMPPDVLKAELSRLSESKMIGD